MKQIFLAVLLVLMIAIPALPAFGAWNDFFLTSDEFFGESPMPTGDVFTDDPQTGYGIELNFNEPMIVTGTPDPAVVTSVDPNWSEPMLSTSRTKVPSVAKFGLGLMFMLIVCIITETRKVIITRRNRVKEMAEEEGKKIGWK